jgi:hypothetical protein
MMSVMVSEDQRDFGGLRRLLGGAWSSHRIPDSYRTGTEKLTPARSLVERLARAFERDSALAHKIKLGARLTMDLDGWIAKT